jgi:hypothetical protein
MTIQEKIDQLASAALRSAPPAPVAPKPTTYMAPFEKPKTVAMVAASEPVAPPVAVEVRAAPFKDEADPELRAQIDDRAARLKKRHKRQSLAVTFAAVAILGSAAFWCYQSPEARAGIGALVPALRQSAEDVKMVGSITSQYDEQLGKISVHGEHVAEATRAIGVDPASVSDRGIAPGAAATEHGIGGEGGTTGERDRALRSKFGVAAKLAGGKPTPAPAPAAMR